MRTPVLPATKKLVRKPTLLEFVQKTLRLPISLAQQTLLKAMTGQPLTARELAIFTLCTGRDAYTPRNYRQVTVVAGARSGKDSRVAAPRALYEALFAGHEKKLTKGERGLVALVAQDAEAAGIAFSYISGYLKANPVLDTQVAEYLARQVILKNGITIRCFPSTAASIRGYTIVAAILDELAYFRVEGAANSDEDIEVAVLRGMGTTQGPLVKISTPSGPFGVLYRDVKRAWGKDDPDLLVWKGSTELMNPSFPDLDTMARVMDPTRFAQEFLAEFATDLESFLSPAVIERCTDFGVTERPPDLTKYKYVAFVDLGGGGGDHSTLAIGHPETTPDLLRTGAASRQIVHDLSWGASRATSELGSIVPQMIEHIRRYHIERVYGDRYTGADGGWVAAEFRKHGIEYLTPEWTPANANEPAYADKSTIYAQVAPLFLTGNVRLLDTTYPLVKELALLERTPGSGGKDRIDHPRGSHDDYANSVCGMIHVVNGKGSLPRPMGMSLGTPKGGGPTALGGMPRVGAAVGGQAAHLGTLYRNPGQRFT